MSRIWICCISDVYKTPSSRLLTGGCLTRVMRLEITREANGRRVYMRIIHSQEGFPGAYKITKYP